MTQIEEEVKNRLLNELLNPVCIPIPNKPELMTVHQSFYQNISLLIKILEEDPEIVKLLKRHKCDLNSFPFGKDERGGLIRLLDIFEQQNKATFSEFVIALKGALNNLANIDFTEYTYIYALNFKSEKVISSEIDGQPFEIFPSVQNIANLINLQELLDYVHPPYDPYLNKAWISEKVKKSIDANHSFLLIRFYAKGDFFADEYARQEMFYVLGLLLLCKYDIEFPEKLLDYSQQQISALSPQHDIIIEDGYLTTHPFRYEMTTDQEDFSGEVFEKFSNFLADCREVRRNSPKIAQIICYALKSYYEASKEDDIAHAFFKFWICIEYCFLKSQGVKETEIINRLKKIVSHDDSFVDLKIDMYYAKRNAFVHRLEMDVGQAQRDHLKLFAQEAIKKLLDLGTKFSTSRELDLFYTYMQQDRSSLQLEKSVIEKTISEHELSSDKQL